jgi:HEAT repeat protein
MTLEPDEVMVSTLIARLTDPEERIRGQAARTLIKLRVASPWVRAHLLALHTDPCWLVRLQAARAAVHLGVAAEEALPILRAFLKDESPGVRWYAVWALEKFQQKEKWSGVI